MEIVPNSKSYGNFNKEVQSIRHVQYYAFRLPNISDFHIFLRTKQKIYILSSSNFFMWLMINCKQNKSRKERKKEDEYRDEHIMCCYSFRCIHAQ